MTSKYKVVNNTLSVGRFHITSIAALGNLTFGWLFTGKHHWLLMLICALDWFIVNLTNRIVDYKEDKANIIAGADFVNRNRSILLGLSYGLLVSSLVIVHLAAPAVTIFRIIFHLLGIIYNWPVLPGGRRLKQAYFFKNAASALGFIITLFCYPLSVLYSEYGAFVFPEGIGWATVAFTVSFFFLFEVSYEVIYDLRDIAGDKQALVRTYPVVHGERIACFIIDGLIFSSMSVLIAGYIFQAVPWRIFILIFAPAIQYPLYKHFVRRGVTSLDCISLTWLGAAMLLIYNAWVSLDLPGTGL